MTDVIADMVDRLIAHAQRMLDEGAYDWPTSRAALEKILADLDARTLGHPGLGRLRQYIAQGDKAWNARRGRDKMTLARPRLAKNAGFPRGRRIVRARRGQNLPADSLDSPRRLQNNFFHLANMHRLVGCCPRVSARRGVERRLGAWTPADTLRSLDAPVLLPS